MSTTEKFKKVKGESITPAATGKIDLHLQSPEKVEATIKKEVAKLSENFAVALLDPSQNKKTAREKIEVIKKMVFGEETESGIVGGLVINGIEDKEGYKNADKFRLKLVKLRTGIANKHKELKQNYLKVSKALDSEKNELSDLLEEIEIEVCTRLRVIDDQIKEKEDAEKKEKQEKLDSRIAEIKASGMQIIEGFYSIGQISVDVVTLEALTDSQYLSLVSKVKAQKEVIEKQEKKANQRKRVEAYLFERAKRKQVEQQIKMDLDAAEQKRERIQNRVDVLGILGLTLMGTYFQYSNEAGNVVVTASEIPEMDSEAWKRTVSELKLKIDSLMVKARQKEENEKRRQKLTSLGFVFSHTEKEYFLETELGKTNYIKESDLFNDNLEFEKWWIEELQPAFENTVTEAKKLREEKQKKDKRTEQRIAELVNGFGFVHGLGEYFLRSNLEKEPELKGKGIYIELKDVQEMNEDSWTEKINQFTTGFNSLKNAEELAKERLKKESKEKRQALLSEHDRVKEYFETVKGINQPEGLKDPGLKGIIEQFNQYLKHYSGLLQNIIQ